MGVANRDLSLNPGVSSIQGHGVASSPNQLLEIKTRRETGNGISWKVEWVFSEDAAAATSRENAAEDVRITDEQIPEYCLLHEVSNAHRI